MKRLLLASIALALAQGDLDSVGGAIIGVAAEPASRTYTVKILVPNPGPVLLAGNLVEASLAPLFDDLVGQAPEDIVDLGMGNPDGATPPHIVEKLVQVAQREDTHGYSTSKGIPRLRRAICHWYRRRWGVEFDWAVAYLSTRRVDVRPLLSGQFPLQDAVKAFYDLYYQKDQVNTFIKSEGFLPVTKTGLQAGVSLGGSKVWKDKDLN